MRLPCWPTLLLWVDPIVETPSACRNLPPSGIGRYPITTGEGSSAETYGLGVEASTQDPLLSLSSR